MKVQIKVEQTCSVKVTKTVAVEFDFQEMLDAVGITRFEYNEDPDSYIGDYLEGEAEQFTEDCDVLSIDIGEVDENEVYETDFVEWERV